MDLDLPVLRTTGRPLKPVSAVVIRPLEPADLALLEAPRGGETPPLQRLRNRHHQLARLIAAGIPHNDAAFMSGYTASRVSILLADPTFKDLVTFYRESVDAEVEALQEKLLGLAKDAADELQERLESEPEKLSTGQLLEVVKVGADRTGHGPSSSTTNVNVNVDLAGRLERARKRLAAIDVTPVERSDGPD